MSAEPLDKPGTRREPQQTEIQLLCPYGGIMSDFRAIIDGGATELYLPARIEGERVEIRLVPVRETIRQDGTRPTIYHIGDAEWTIVDMDRTPQSGLRSCNGFVNLEVTAHDAPAGVIRTLY